MSSCCNIAIAFALHVFVERVPDNGQDVNRTPTPVIIDIALYAGPTVVHAGWMLEAG
jgi:hypothetical protein